MQNSIAKASANAARKKNKKKKNLTQMFCDHMSYKKGRAFEYRVRNMFRNHGYDCDRKAGSKPIDIIAKKKGKTIFISECKKTMRNFIYIPEKDITRLYKAAGKQRATPLITYGFDRTPIYVAYPSESKKLKKQGNNRKLNDFLRGYK